MSGETVGERDFSRLPTDPAVRAVASAFAAAHPELADPIYARDLCEQISEGFVRACRDAGLVASVISGARFGEVAEFPGVRLLLDGHFAALVEPGVVYDWTARQFDPEEPVPSVSTLAEWRAAWPSLGPD